MDKTFLTYFPMNFFILALVMVQNMVQGKYESLDVDNQKQFDDKCKIRYFFASIIVNRPLTSIFFCKLSDLQTQIQKCTFGRENQFKSLVPLMIPHNVASLSEKTL